MSDLDQTFAALADPTRRRVVELLRGGARRPGELAESLGMSPPALSRHLKILRQGGLVEERLDALDARVRLYSLRPEPFEAVGRWVLEVEAFWRNELNAFKAHVEATRLPDDPR